MKYCEIKEIARNLRKNQTTAEGILWSLLRNRSFMNKKFVRQYPLIYESRKNDHQFYVADFYCHEHKLVIELDGKIHEYQKRRDYNRDQVINSMGLCVLHIKNEELDNIEKVKKKICSCF